MNPWHFFWIFQIGGFFSMVDFLLKNQLTINWFCGPIWKIPYPAESSSKTHAKMIASSTARFLFFRVTVIGACILLFDLVWTNIYIDSEKLSNYQNSSLNTFYCSKGCLSYTNFFQIHLNQLTNQCLMLSHYLWTTV